MTATCFEWVSDSWSLYGMAKVTGVVISLTNWIIRKVLIRAVKNHKFHSVSQESNVIMMFVFIAQFLNTGVIILLRNADFKEHQVSVLNSLFIIGQATDFNEYWYQKVGHSIVMTMIINVGFPIFELCLNLARIHINSLRDRDMTSDN